MPNEQRERYERDGFVPIPAALDPCTVDILRAECAERVSTARAAVASGTRYSLAIPGPVDGRAAAPAVDALLGIAKGLLEADVEPSFVLWHAVTAQLCDGRGWHQAMAYHHLPYSPNAVSVPLDEMEFIVMLDDATTDHTAPWFAPGYHVSPMLEHRKLRTAQMGFELVDPERQLVLDETVMMPMRAGDAVGYTLGTPHACVCSSETDLPTEVLSLRIGFRVVGV
jgi:hypothetical protein